VIRWFEANPLGVTFASVCAGLLLISLLLAVFWSLPPSVPDAVSDGDEAALVMNVPELDDSEPLEAYSVITERPVFNASRLPVIDEDPSEGESEELLAEEVDAPEIELSGVVITPSIRMVTLRSKDRSESLVAFEGQPLEGNYGSWHVSDIEPREITLSSDSGEELQLKLQVHDVTIEQPPKLEDDEDEDDDDEESAEAGEPAVAGDSDQPLSRAEEIRQRIAQRREELRRAAEEKEQGEEKEPDYSTAIQSMISGSKRKQEQDEN